MPTKSLEYQLSERGILGNFPRFGKLRKGAPKPDDLKKGLKDLDYFRLTLETPYEETIRPAFEQLFGQQPREFPNVLLAAESADQAFQYWKEDWAHARLLKRCDEETIIVHWDDNIPGYSTEPLKCSCNPLKRDCRDHGRMDIVIPALFELTGEWGKFTIETTSIYDVIALRSYMKMADAFMQKLPNVAFGAIPFTIGRAVRSVPVTINGKRSIKPMSLLYAKIEPDFNQQVFTPMLTKPAQLLLAGVNPVTGESPEGGLPDPEIEAEFEQAQNWDRDYVNAHTIHQFDHENHQMNAIDKMIADGNITDVMGDEEVIQTVEILRKQRATEKQNQQSGKNASKPPVKGSNSSAADDNGQSDLEWVANVKTVATFLAKAQKNFKLDHGGVLNALRWAMSDYSIQNVAEFVGTKEDAWAACVTLYCDYDPAEITEYITDATNPVRIHALSMIERLDIPF